MNKQVIMNAEIRFRFDTPLKLAELLDSSRINLDIGDFEFRIGEKSILFGFDADGFNADDDNVVSYETGHGLFFNDYDISNDIFDEEYRRIGLTRDRITAAYLANVEDIIEFFLNIEDCCGKSVPFNSELVRICFTDENGVSYPVSQDVIDRYNAINREKCKLR